MATQTSKNGSGRVTAAGGHSAPLAIRYVPTAQLVPYARNARTHSDAQVAAIAGSIKAFGFTNPLLVGEDGVLIAGHGRLMAAHLLKLEQVPVIEIKGLTPPQQRALVLADNRIALSAGWDAAMLREELTDLRDVADLKVLGFEPAELSDLLGQVPAFGATSAAEQGQLDQQKPITCPNCGVAFVREA